MASGCACKHVWGWVYAKGPYPTIKPYKSDEARAASVLL